MSKLQFFLFGLVFIIFGLLLGLMAEKADFGSVAQAQEAVIPTDVVASTSEQVAQYEAHLLEISASIPSNKTIFEMNQIELLETAQIQQEALTDLNILTSKYAQKADRCAR